MFHDKQHTKFHTKNAKVNYSYWSVDVMLINISHVHNHDMEVFHSLSSKSEMSVSAKEIEKCGVKDDVHGVTANLLHVLNHLII